MPRVRLALHFIALGVRGERLGHAPLRIERVSEEAARQGALLGREIRARQQPAQPRLGGERILLAEVGGREAQLRIRIARQARERPLGPLARLAVGAAIARDAREPRQRDRLARIELDRPLKRRLRIPHARQREQRGAAAGMREGQRRVGGQQEVKLLKRLGVTIEPEQAQAERVARRLVLARKRERPAQQPLRLAELAGELVPQRQHVEDQRMLEALGQRRLGQLRRLRQLPALRAALDREQSLAIRAAIAAHGSAHMRCRLAATYSSRMRLPHSSFAPSSARTSFRV